MNEPEIIVAELKLPVSVDTLAAIADALGSVHGKRVLLMRQEGSLLRIFKPAPEGREINLPAPEPGMQKLIALRPDQFEGLTKQLADMHADIERAQYQLGACRAAAKGEPLPPEALPASPALDDVLDLRRSYERLLNLEDGKRWARGEPNTILPCASNPLRESDNKNPVT